MEEKLVKIYIADCGKKYHSRSGAIAHEKNCKCWTNPKHKTCLTCDWALNQDRRHMCFNEDFNKDIHFTPAHENAPKLNINCPLWSHESYFLDRESVDTSKTLVPKNM